ncbi:MAG: GAF domain-containing protein [Chloroflexi bacterium]|nr:GAF domain-containing protein [Chloroflexota bacterium]
MQVETPARTPASDQLEATLLILAPMLGLMVAHWQGLPVQRALTIGHKLADTSSSRDIAQLVANYMGDNCALVDLTLYEYDDDLPVQAHATLLPHADAATFAEITFDLSGTLPELDPERAHHLADVFTTPLVEAAKRDIYRTHHVTQMTLLALMVQNRRVGTLGLAGEPLESHTLRGLQHLAHQIAVQVQNRSLVARTTQARDEAQYLYHLGQTVMTANDLPHLVKAAYAEFDPAPDQLIVEAVPRDAEQSLMHLLRQVTVSAQGLETDAAIKTDLTKHALTTTVQTLAKGTPVLINNLKTEPGLLPPMRAFFETRNFQAVGLFPVMRQGQLSHIIAAAYAAPHIYTAREIRLLHHLSEQIGYKLRHWELLHDAQTQIAQLTRLRRLVAALQSTARIVNQHLVSTDVLQDLCRSLSETLLLDYTAIFRLDQVPASGNIVGEHPARLGTDTLLPLTGFTVYQQLQKNRAPVVIEDVESAQEQLGPTHEQFQTLKLTTMVLAPLVMSNELIGMVVLATSQPDYAFGPEEQQLIQALSTQIATSLRNTELYTEIQRRANQLERIAAFGRLVTSTFEHDEILRRVMDVIPNLLPADQVSLALVHPGEVSMRVIALTHTTAPQESRLPMAGSSVEEVLQTQMPMLIPELQSSPYSDHQYMTQEGLSSVLTVPLIIGGRPLGTLNIGHQRPRIYTPTDLTLVQQVGNQIATALENARLFQTARQRATYEEALSGITSRLQQPTDLRDLLHQTMQDLGQVLGASKARVRLRTQSSPNGARETKLEK